MLSLLKHSPDACWPDLWLVDPFESAGLDLPRLHRFPAQKDNHKASNKANSADYNRRPISRPHSMKIFPDPLSARARTSFLSIVDIPRRLLDPPGAGLAARN